MILMNTYDTLNGVEINKHAVVSNVNIVRADKKAIIVMRLGLWNGSTFAPDNASLRSHKRFEFTLEDLGIGENYYSMFIDGINSGGKNLWQAAELQGVAAGLIDGTILGGS